MPVGTVESETSLCTVLGSASLAFSTIFNSSLDSSLMNNLIPAGLSLQLFPLFVKPTKSPEAFVEHPPQDVVPIGHTPFT